MRRHASREVSLRRGPRAAFPLLVLATVLPVQAGAGGGPGLLPTLPGDETILNEGIEPTPLFDSGAVPIGFPDGRVCLLNREGFRLEASISDDGGASFPTEVAIAGVAGVPDAFDARAVLSDGGRVHVAMVLADPAGGLGLYYSSSDDGCRSWQAPRRLVSSAEEPGSPLRARVFKTLEIASGSDGLVAIAWVDDNTDRVFAIASADGGATWKPWVRIDDATQDRGEFDTSGLDLGIDPISNTIHVVFVQDRFVPGLGGLRDLRATRSTDLGSSFEPDRPLSRPSPSFDTLAFTLRPDLEIVPGGPVLVVASGQSFFGFPGLYVFRSTDGGATFDTVLQDLNFSISFNVFAHAPRVLARSSGTEVLIFYIDFSLRLSLRRSTDSGATFGPVEILTPDAVFASRNEEFAPVEAADGTIAVSWVARNDRRLRIRSSTDAGVTWGAPVPIDDPAFFSDVFSHVPVFTLSAVGDGDLLVTRYTFDLQPPRPRSLRSTRAVAGSLVFSPEIRVDRDDSSGEVPTNDFLVATDGDSGLYVLFRVAATDGTRTYFRSSLDRGGTFGPPILFDTPPAAEGVFNPLRLSAAPDGSLHLLSSRFLTGPREHVLQVRSSSDRGQTWSQDVIVATSTSNFLGESLDTGAGGRVSVFWTTRNGATLARSEDAGATFTFTELDEGLTLFNDDAFHCIDGDRIIVGWRGPSLTSFTTAILFRTSLDGGLSFGPTVDLRADPASSAIRTALVCSPSGRAALAWFESIGLATRVFDGTAWRDPVVAPSEPFGRNDPIELALTRSDDSGIAILSGGRDAQFQPGVFSTVSTDGGFTFSPNVRLDTAVPFSPTFPAARRLVSDGAGNVWSAWREDRAGSASIHVTRRSTDGGVSWGPPTRVDNRQPQATYINRDLTPAALPGTALFTWRGERTSTFLDLVFNRDVLNQPPVADAGPDRTVECGGPDGTLVGLDGSGSSDPDGDPLTYSWTGPFPEGGGTAGGVSPDVTLSLGDSTITLVVNDGSVDSAPDDAIITVADTTAPEGGITSPVDGACFGEPVTILDDAADVCDDSLERTYAPGPGPDYGSHGDLTVTLTATDDSGNALTDEVSFTIDLVDPGVTLLAGLPGLFTTPAPTTVAFADAFATSDEDGAAGDVVREVVVWDGCPVYDGDEWGNGDGLLRDETAPAGRSGLCRVRDLCGRSSWTDPVVRVEATDCGGNVAAAEMTLPGGWSISPGDCAP